MADIIKFDGLTANDISAGDMLREIAAEEPEYVFAITWPKDSGVPTYHSNTSDMAEILMRLQEFVHKLFNGDFA